MGPLFTMQYLISVPRTPVLKYQKKGSCHLRAQEMQKGEFEKGEGVNQVRKRETESLGI